MERMYGHQGDLGDLGDSGDLGGKRVTGQRFHFNRGQNSIMVHNILVQVSQIFLHLGSKLNITKVVSDE